MKVFQRSIPQFETGFKELIEQVNDAVATIPGLHVTGNFKSGVAVGDCIAAGMDMAAEVAKDSSRECSIPTEPTATSSSVHQSGLH